MGREGHSGGKRPAEPRRHLWPRESALTRALARERKRCGDGGTWNRSTAQVVVPTLDRFTASCASSTLPLRRVARPWWNSGSGRGSTAEERASRNSERTAFVARQAQPPGLVSGTSLVLTLAFRRLHLEDGREAQSTPRNVRVFLTKAREIKLRTLCTQKRKTHVIYYDSISNVECWLLQLRSNTTVGAHGAVLESRQSARSDVRRHPPATTPPRPTGAASVKEARVARASWAWRWRCRGGSRGMRTRGVTARRRVPLCGLAP